MSLVAELKAAEQDYEWYPSTPEIIDIVKQDLLSQMPSWQRERGEPYVGSVLDIGAGDGRVLNALTKGQQYAIEKSTRLIKAMGKKTCIVGTDFLEQTLIDKRVDNVYSNPPYKVFEEWCEKIILEANCNYIYLTIPTRWIKSQKINDALEARGVEADILGTYTFEEGERQARAVVNVIKIDLTRRGTDAFYLWFSTYFNISAPSSSLSSYAQQRVNERRAEEACQLALTEKKGVVNSLVDSYQTQMHQLLANYTKLGELSSELLSELNVDIDEIRNALKLKISGLKNVYWEKMFDHMDVITNKLISSTRKTLRDQLTAQTSIDFTPANIHAIVIWAIKHANDYYDAQVIEMCEKMVERANIVLYKSNQRTFRDEEWRYFSKPRDLDRYSLEYRVILERCGCCDEDGLNSTASNFLSDLRTIAMNIGFDISSCEGINAFTWTPGKRNHIQYKDHETGETLTLFSARAYKKGTIHIHFNQHFICKLNVEFGRLKGWLKSKEQAAEELGISMREAAAAFGSIQKIEGSSLLKLGLAA